MTGQAYAYTGGSPTNATDPSGKCFVPFLLPICIGLLGALLEAGGAEVIEATAAENTEIAVTEAETLAPVVETAATEAEAAAASADIVISEADTVSGGCSAQGQSFVYRGVHALHPALDAARKGWATPGNVNGIITPEQHNTGDLLEESPFTSWTTKLEIAKIFALRNGPGGVILRLPTGAPPPGATWSWEWSVDEYGESELLLRGIRGGAEVLKP